MNRRFLIAIGLIWGLYPIFAGAGDRENLSNANKKNDKPSGQILDVQPGEILTAAIAIGEINRIVLPFDRPEIRTLNPSTAEIQGHVLYIAPVDPAKIYLYVTDAQNPDLALTLSLHPKEIPPQELTLNLAAEAAQEPQRQSAQTRTSPQNVSLEDQTRQLLKTLAMGQIPQGYRFRNPGSNESIRCRQKHLLIQTRQVFDSDGMQVRVGVLKNNGKAPLVLEEDSCLGTTPIQAVATYPSGPLRPGQEAEIYLLVPEARASNTRNRPTLIGKPS